MNIIAKGVPGKEYIITDMMATSLSRKAFESAQEQNPDLLSGYRYIPFNDTDFSWWSRITKKLTARKIVQAYFEIDFGGKVREF